MLCFCCYMIKRTQHTSMTLFVLPREVQVQTSPTEHRHDVARDVSTVARPAAWDTCSAVVGDPPGVSYLVGQTSPATCRWSPARPDPCSVVVDLLRVRVGGVVLGSADRHLRSAETTPFDSKICPLRTDASSPHVGSTNSGPACPRPKGLSRYPAKG